MTTTPLPNLTPIAVEARVKSLTDDGFVPWDHETIRPGVRVHNAGQQYHEARRDGTATVAAVFRKRGGWEQTYGRLNIEVVVVRDDGTVGQWADYGTEIATRQRVPGRPDAMCALAMRGDRWCRRPIRHDGDCEPSTRHLDPTSGEPTL